ncbi:MAG: hypothetical protein OXH53_11060 [bacterium]|nr:hypothetical protein [bacterium]
MARMISPERATDMAANTATEDGPGGSTNPGMTVTPDGQLGLDMPPGVDVNPTATETKIDTPRPRGMTAQIDPSDAYV